MIITIKIDTDKVIVLNGDGTNEVGACIQALGIRTRKQGYPQSESEQVIKDYSGTVCGEFKVTESEGKE